MIKSAKRPPPPPPPHTHTHKHLYADDPPFQKSWIRPSLYDKKFYHKAYAKTGSGVQLWSGAMMWSGFWSGLLEWFVDVKKAENNSDSLQAENNFACL